MHIQIGTHSGFFHLDELVGVAVIKCCHEVRGDEVTIVRTRDPKRLAGCNYLVDVGGVYDAALGRFDHHQEGGAGKREDGFLFAAAGLVWKHFGTELCGGVNEVVEMVDRRVIQSIDYRDNHGPQGRGSAIVEFADMLAALFPAWNESGDQTGDQAFSEALQITERLITRYIVRAKAEYDAVRIVQRAIQEAADPRIVYLSVPCPWRETLIQHPSVLIVVSENPHQNEWLVECVSSAHPKLRVSFPERLRGLDRSGLVASTGVLDVRFVHKSGHLGIVGSREGAFALANLVLSHAESAP